MNHIKYRADISGLRAIAVIYVFLFHLHSGFSGGFIGVDLFFIISGYLISGIIMADISAGQFSFLKFYARRIKRIFPALFAVLLVTAIVAVICLQSGYYQMFFKTFRYAAGQASNFFFARKVNYFASGSEMQPLLHTWSLGVEEQFYLIWPLLILLFVKIAATRPSRMLYAFIAVMLISFAFNLVCIEINSNKAFYMFYTRAWEFCFGAILALNIIPHFKKNILNEALAMLGLGLVLVAPFIIDNNASFVKGSVFLPCIGISMLIYSGQLRKGCVYKLLSFKPLAFIGLISYSLYLWHWPVIVFYKHMVDKNISLQGGIIIVGLSVAMSILSYYFIERRTRYINIPDRKVIAYGIAAMAVFMLGGLWLASFSEAGWRVQNPGKITELKQEAVSREFFNLPESKNLLDIDYQKNQQPFDALVIGDSHALHYFPVIRKYMAANGLDARELSSGGCPPFTGSYKVVNIRANNSRNITTKCEVFKDKILQYSADPRVKYIFMAMRQDLYTETDHQEGHKVFLTKDANGELSKKEAREVWGSGLEETIKYFQGRGKIVVLLGQVPVLATNPKTCAEITIADNLFNNASELALKQKACFTIDAAYSASRLAYSKSKYGEMAVKYNLAYFDPSPYFPSASPGGNMVYKDADHLNINGSRYIYPFLLQGNILKLHGKGQHYGEVQRVIYP